MTHHPRRSFDAVFCDVDGCLTSERSVFFDIDAISTLMSFLRDEGRKTLPRLILCTGRPQPYVECLLKLLHLDEPAICEAGSVVYTLHDNRARLIPAVTPAMVDDMARVRRFLVHRVIPEYSGACLQFGKQLQVSVYSENHDDLLAMAGQLRAHTDDMEPAMALDISTSHYYLNITPAGIDKGTAIRWLMEELGLERSRVAGIGDTEGDLSTRAATSFFACPANASPTIREIADYTSPHEEARGVMDILRRLARGDGDRNSLPAS